MEESPTLPNQTASPIKPRPGFRIITHALTLVIGILLGSGGLFAYQKYASKPPITTYEECVNAEGSAVTEMYPSVCITRDGIRFVEPTIPDPTETPANGTVIGINLNSCCQCPESVPQSQIGTDGWEIYNPQKDYGNKRPPYCDAAGICAPCPPLPTPTCTPRPKCLDMEPRCMIPETEDMCPPDSPPSSGAYTCPKGGWENCMPILTAEAQKQCSKEALDWKKQNCPNFQGAAY